VAVCDRGCAASSGELTAATRRALDARILVAIRAGRRSRWRSRWRYGTWRSVLSARARDRCAACLEPLVLPLRATSRSVTVEPPLGTPFTVTLDLPLSRCPECGDDNVPSELATAVLTATLAAVGVPVSRPRRRAGRGSPPTP